MHYLSIIKRLGPLLGGPLSFCRPLLALLLLFGLVASAVAQETPAEPPRTGLDEAPEREPQILSEELLPDGRLLTVIEIPAAADTYIASERPNENFGSGALFLGYNLTPGDNFGAQRILIRFDVQEHVPAEATIDDARLRLRLSFSRPADDEPMGTVLRRLASSWDEFTVTWNTEPVWAEIRAEASVGSTPDWYEWEITGLVDEWHGGLDNHGMEIAEAGTIVDTRPPTSRVDPLPAIINTNSFTVSWTGDDGDGSGIQYFDLQYRFNHGSWILWQQQTLATSAIFTAMVDGIYDFEVRAVDNVGNVEAFANQPEASIVVDVDPPFVEPRLLFPIIINE